MTQKKTFYITTTLPYVNAKPHIGFAREIVQADVLARYQKLLSREVFFNTGVDEHGQKIFEKARERKIRPQAYCDQMALNFQWFKEKLNIDYTKFIRTTDKAHMKTAQEFWKKVDRAGYIYKKKYQTKYCVGCELEKTDSELNHGKCPDHPNQAIELIDEENYFFKFSAFEGKLLKFYQTNPTLIKPSKRFKEIKKFVANGLEDFSISRLRKKMPWGVPVPGDEQQVMYVWFDALVNYISTLGWPTGELFEKFWNEAEERIQFCGKDNLRQQSAMWQAMLMAGGIKNSSQIYINGFINVAGQKMSKSLGNVIGPEEMVARYGVDGTRYLLLTMGSFGEDTDITWEKMDEKYNADLANGLGNFVSRVITLMQKDNFKFKFLNTRPILKDEVNQKMKEMAVKQIMEDIWSLIVKNDRYIEKTKPWELIKKDSKQFKEVIGIITKDLAKIGAQLEPFLPETSGKIKEALKVKKIKPLFKRIKKG